MQVQENISLKTYNTFGIDAKARYFAHIRSVEDLQELAALTLSPKISNLILGGGSNILFLNDFDGLVLKNDIKGIDKVDEDDENVFVKSGAGENWHQFVLHCIENNWAGVENLSLIPGCIGASPMQNIGAYGVEIKDVFHELTAFHLEEKCNYTFSVKDCAFGYRDSVFKNKYKDQFMILNVTYKLKKKPAFNTSYGAIEQELNRMGITEISIDAISQAVINIRSSKLPDPKEIGNAGSFFKNPSVDKEKFLSLKAKFENIVGYENSDGTVKLAAGWLIEHSGPTGGTSWKGYREGDAGVHAKQSLVLVNYGAATGKQLYELSENIVRTVSGQFGVKLEREVNIL
ncbi:MAG: UDP-N-acetylmuramate dehydrogenase [Chitinophagaceae bacterium]